MSSDAAITDDALEEEEETSETRWKTKGEISEQRKTKCLFSKRVYANAHGEALNEAATDFGFRFTTSRFEHKQQCRERNNFE